MKIKSKFLIPIISLFACAMVIGTTYSAWVINSSKTSDNNIQANVPEWSFGLDDDFSIIRDNETYPCENATVTAERGIRQNSFEAVRITNTAGAAKNVDRSVILKTDRPYLLNEINVMKVEFDYYHRYKRAQYNNGLPKIALVSQNNDGTYTTKGNTQGGGNTVADANSITSKAVYIASDIDGDWWHLEYFITGLCPPYCAYKDSVPNPAKTYIHGIKIIDRNIIDFPESNPTNIAYAVIDNLRFTSTLAPRLGLFNGTSSFANGGHYWMKIAWVGQLAGGFDGVSFSFSAPGIIEQDTTQNKSPFYLLGVGTGTVTVTCELSIVGLCEPLSISNVITVT